MFMPRSVSAPVENRAAKDMQFAIGQDLHGRWIVTEARGRSGGLFVSREAALKYLASEWGRDPASVLWSNEPISLWT
jgi:hypothetical protein